MSELIELLPFSEQISLRLRGVFEQYGYKKYSMSNFEPYDLYSENRNFIQSEGIITFTGANNRLMALRPDVTTSIIKHSLPNGQPEKLYYLENVFRTDAQTKDYKEVSQMGLEYIGGDKDYAQLEVVFLALQSLAALDTDYWLNINHMGLIEGVLESVGLEGELAEQVKSEIKQKNSHDIVGLARVAGLSEDKIQQLIDFVSLCGDFRSCFSLLKAFDMNEKIGSALLELYELEQGLEILMPSAKIQFDASVINDMDYYNGMVFRGYINAAPRAVLSGGRYDNMMKRFQKEQSALGFALYLGEIDRAFYSSREYDADIYLYQNNFEPREVASVLQHFIKKGMSVYVGDEREPHVSVRHRYEMTENGAREVLDNA